VIEETIGQYEEFQNLRDYVSLTFHPTTFPVRWGQCSATADFLADYFARMDSCTGNDRNKKTEIQSAISYVLNEVVENAVKFHDGGNVLVRVGVKDGALLIEATNQVKEAQLDRLRATFEELVSGDPHEILMQRVEANADNPDQKGSGLGFLTMLTDYSAELGWKFSSQSATPGHVYVHTMARLPLES